ncbi:non-ribosomal peptide synthetase [Thalassomonas actiniarum]|uniref:Amino acid adenylation domain-containing protein n=1 Tax=Thalassomonas actiniarum TaxID=485447 RepID=A0AAF0C239_9GAMM|nr:non-ribosomal peptide synthetase [Thalassomonas actiniarum]WDD98092.1 amino acid adenylation domain-containing protein [Thalassomonas actiniarum]
MEQTPSQALTLEQKRELLKKRLAKTKAAKPSVPAITKRPGEQDSGCVLSFAQQRLWLLEQMDGSSAHYNLPGALKLSGQLDFSALENAFNTLLKRHESLRTCFVEDEAGEARQMIRPADRIRVTLEDLSGLASPEQGEMLTSCIATEAQQPFDLKNDLMLRAKVLKLSDSEHVLLVTLHHIAADGWSMSVLVKEFSALYSGYQQGQAAVLPPLPIQYGDYAHWQRQWLQGEVLDKQLSYWQKQLAQLPQVHNLPLDYARPKVQTFAGDAVESFIAQDQLMKLKNLCREQGATLFMGLHAAFSVLLGRYSNENDIVIGSPIANREQAEVAGLIGFFVNTLVLRCDLSAAPGFKTLLGQSKQMLLDAYRHQQVPFEQIVERLQPERNLQHSPLFQVVLVLQNNDETSLELPGLSLTPLAQEKSQAKYDLTLTVEESEQGLSLEWEYNRDLFKAGTIQAMASSFELLVGALLNEPEENVLALPVVSEAGRRQQLLDWNNTAVPYPECLCIHELFEQRVEKDPGATALILENQQLSYGELNSRANRLARYLIEQKGVKPDTLVGISLTRSFDMLVGILAIIKAGGAYVPLDASYPGARLEYMVADAGLNCVLTQKALTEKLPLDSSQLLLLDDDALLTELGNYSSENIPCASLTLTAEHLAYVIYTSGSTGQPKGVLLEHQGLCNLALAQIREFAIEANSKVLQFASMAFDAATSEFFTALARGACLVLASEQTVKSPEALNALVSQYQISHATLPPVLLPHLDARAWSSVETLVVAGDACAKGDARKWSENRRFINAYGPSETTVCATMGSFEPEQESLHIGRPINNTRAYVLNDLGALVPPGVAGELHIGGAGLARGYLNREALTAEKFIELDLGGGKNKQRLYKTGDLVRQLADGNLEFLGRIDHQVKIRGFRIELGEIEQVLASCEQVLDALVLVTENEQQEPALAAYLVVEGYSGYAGDELADLQDAIKQLLQQRLPAFMIPAFFVLLDKMPLTANGKVDRKALPEAQSGRLTSAYQAPSGEAELALAQIFARLLGLTEKEISASASFFELGGHSLLAVRLVSAIRERFAIEMQVKDVFESSVLEVLARRIQKAETGVVRKQVTAVSQDKKELPASFSQQRLWFIDQMEGGSSHYNMPAAFIVNGNFDLAAAESALTEIIHRHQVLRTVFADSDSGVRQHIVQDFDFTLADIDLSAVSGEEQSELLKEKINQQRAYVFDLKADLMLKVTYFSLAATRGALVFNMHHIAADGWSIGVMLQEFSQLYQGAVSGQVVTLEPLSLQYGDYACWQHDFLAGDVLEQQLAYWQQQLNQLPLVHNLPLDFDRPKIQGFAGATTSLQLDGGRLKQLQALALEHNITLFMLLHGAFSLVLSRHSNTADIVIGTPVANRLQKELEPLVGCFINTLVLRLDCSGEQSLADFLARVKDVNLEAQQHQDVPFEHLVEHLNPVRDLGYSPLFQIMFTMNTTQSQEFALGELDFTPLDEDRVEAKYELTLNAIESEAGLELVFEYNTALFSNQRIQGLAQNLTILLEDMLTGQASNVGNLALLSAQQQEFLLSGVNDTARDYPQTPGIHLLFEQQVAKSPEAIAMICEGQSLTYRALDQQAEQLAHYLKARGVGRDVLVGLCLERSFELVISLLAVLKAGGAFVPLDPAYPEQRLAYMLSDSGLKLVLSQSSLKHKLGDYAYDTVLLDDENTKAGIDAFKGQQGEALSSSAAATDLAYVIYTSGSTGQPKGVAVEHGGLVNLNYFELEDFQVEASSRVLHLVSFSFDPAISHLFICLNAGATLYLTDSQRDLSQFMAEHDITHGIFPAALLAAQRYRELPKLKVVGTGGEHCPRDIADLWANNRSYYNLYGPTETTITATRARHQHKIDKHTIGYPVANVQCYVLDQMQQLLPFGAEGELYIGGAGLARGYLHKETLTAERFISAPWSGERLYRTGDLVRYQQDGQIEYIGRIDDQVKIRGFRVELGEIEHLLASQPQVNSAVVLLREDTRDLKQLVAYVTLEQTEQEPARVRESLRQNLSAALPEHMVPAVIQILDNMPFTTNGKVDRKALPVPESQDQAFFIAPETAAEIRLAAIWGELLAIDGKKIGRNGNFFALGGHSLLCVRLAAEVNEVFGRELAVKTIFEYPVLQALAERIEQDSQDVQQFAPVAIGRNRETYEASFAQQRLWFLDQMASDSSQYNIASAFRLSGTFDLVAAETAFRQIIKRHEPLRTVFASDGHKPVQIIKEDVDFSLKVIDLTEVDAGGQKHQVSQAITYDSELSFDLTRELMLRARVYTLSASESVLLLNVHHIAADGWSMGILVNEFVHFYRAALAGENAELSPLSLQYVDFAHWQNSQLSEAHLAPKIQFWLEKLRDIPQVHGLPLDQPRKELEHRQGAQVSQIIPATLTRKMKDFSLKQQASLFMTLQSAFAIHLARWSNETDIVMGSPSAGRSQKAFHGLIGLFLNTQVFRTDLGDNPTFIELLSTTRQEHLLAGDYNDVPFELLVEHLNPVRSLKHTPVFQVLINMNNTPGTDVSFPGLNFSSYEEEKGFENKYDLTLYINEYQEQGEDLIRLDWVYDSGLFNAEHIELAAREFNALLTALMQTPETSVFSHAWSAAASWQRLPETDSVQEMPAEGKPENILSLFEAQVARGGDRDAVVTQDSRLSYRELNQQANQLAALLQDKYHIGLNSRVAFAMTRSVDRVVAMLAILKAGAAYVPLTQELPIARIAMMLEDSQASLVLTDVETSAWAAEFTSLAEVLVINDDAVIMQRQVYPGENLACPGIGEQTLSHMIFTSGSTGRPKGVLGNHGALYNRVSWMHQAFPYLQEERAAHITSMAFIRGVWELWVPLCGGVALELFDRDVVKDPKAFLQQLTERGVTRMVTAPSLMRAIDAYLRVEPEFSARLRYWFVSGEALATSLAHQFVERLPETQFVNLYGSTEVLSDVLFYGVTGRETQAYVPLGQAISGVATTVVDRSGNPVPPGMVGELVVVGKSVTLGYAGLKELTKQQFINTPAGRGYRTGDLVRITGQGQVSYLGRIDHQLKIRGYRIELSEVESHLMQLHFIQDVVVMPYGDEPALAAYFTLKQPVSVDEGNIQSLIRTELSTRLPAYMLPSVFIPLKEWPLTPNGKVNRKALPEPDHAHLAQDYQAPESEGEKALAAIWSSLLSVEEQVLGLKANFFELGGHSLLSVRLIAEIKQAFNKALAVRDIFEHPLLGQLAGLIAQTPEMLDGGKIKPVSALLKQLPTSFSQQRLWFLDEMDGGSAHYNIPFALKVEGDFCPEIAREVFNRIVARHEPLRTVFSSTEGGEATQIIMEQAEINFAQHDLSDLAAQEQDHRLRELISADQSGLFDLSRDVMLRASYLKIAEHQGVLLINVHHIASDGWSTRLIIKEFSSLYHALSAKESPELPELALRYSDYAHWQRHWFSEHVLKDQLSYWQQQLSGLPQVHHLPLSGVRPQYQTFAGAEYSWSLSSELSQKLKQFAAEQQISLFMLLHGAFSLVISRNSGESDIVVGTPVANRQQKELESLVGFFVNTLVLRLDCSPELSLQQYLERVKQVNLDALAHQDTPFEYLVEQLQPQRSTAYSPLFQIMFSMDTNEDVSLTLPEVALSLIEPEEVSAKFDLTLNAVDMGDQLAFDLEYNSDLFAPQQIQRLAQHIGVLLENIVSDGSQLQRKLQDITVLPRQEQEYLVQTLNQNADFDSQPLAIHQLVSQQALKTPDNTAVFCHEQGLSYRELEQRANQLAYHLCQQGVEADSLVGICLERSLDMMVSLLAILKTGAAYVPLDPAYPAARLAYMMQDSGMQYLVTRSDIRVLPEQQKVTAICIDENKVQQLWRSGEYEGEVPQQWRPDSLAYVIYTSGTTGQPKGVMIEHGSASLHVQVMKEYLQLKGQDNVLQFASVSFDTFIEQTFAALATGACLHLRDDKVWSSEDFYRYSDRHQITVTDLSPAYLMELLRESELSSSYWQQTSLNRVVVGGEALPLGILSRWQQLGLADTCRLFNAYGPTEATITSSISEIDVARSWLPIGKALTGRALYVLDNNLQLVPFGATGELYIGGPCLARGYLNQAQLTDERFISWELPNGQALRLYRTGDRVRYLADGQLAFAGRVDEQVKIRGFRIELAEIEEQLSLLAEVSGVVVLARDDGDQPTRLVAYLLLNGNGNGNGDGKQAIEGIRSELAKVLPAYMLPSVYLVLPEFPLMPNGKVDKSALPEPEDNGGDGDYQAASNEAEFTLVRLWSELLNQEAETLSVNANFFALGGDSILSIQLVSKARQVGLTLSVKDIFEFQSIRALAAKVKTNKQVLAPQKAVEGELALLPIQHDFFSDETELHHYNQSVLLTLDTQLEPEHLRQMVTALYQRHDALRLRFEKTDDGWRGYHQAFDQQMLDSTLVFQPLPGEDFSVLTPYAQQAQLSLSLSDGPMFKVVHFTNNSNDSRLLLIIHHLMVDGVSWRILLEDVDTLLSSQDPTQPKVLADKTSSFQQWGAFLQDYAQSESLKQERSYWLETLSLPLATSIAPPDSGPEALAGQTQLANAGFELTQELTGQLLAQSGQGARLSINELLIAALWLGMQRWNGQAALQLDLEGHGRESLTEQLDLSQTVGWFTSLYPLRLNDGDGYGEGNLEQLTTKVKQAYREIPHHGIGYGILKYLSQDAAFANLPESAVLFNYLGQFDQVTRDNDGLSVAGEDVGLAMSENRRQTHELTINALISSACLKFDLGFNLAQHSQSSIEQLLVLIKTALTELIDFQGEMPEGLESESLMVSPAEAGGQGDDEDLSACIIKLNQSQAQTNIFCLHPLGGTVSCYADLATEVEDQAAFYGIQTPALATELRFLTIESLAAYYVEGIMAVQASGPYVLLGWSLGGSLAYEVAVQLAARGQEIAYLGLFDEAPVLDSTDAEPALWYQRIKGLFEDEFDWSPIETCTQDAGIAALVQQAMTNGFAPDGIEAEVMSRYFRYLVDTSLALNQYQAKSSSLPLELFKVAKPVSENNALADYGWSDISSGEIEIVDVEGKHSDMVKQPYVSALAKRLKLSLERLNNQTEIVI